ncbi:MAG: hypothetical protein LBM02_09900 [Lachnospiraceae bacterium]|jgi:hypothetical protein|nr:hypothetical protein [Lachnospiraceae bacterium]
MKITKDDHLDEVLELYKKTNSSEKAAEELALKYNFNYNPSIARKIRRWIKGLNLTDNKNKMIEDSEVFKKALDKKISKSKYYIITSAQNATKINKPFWKNILSYSKYLNAEIEVIPIRYKNPTSTFKELPNDWWDSKLHDYLIANRYKLHNNLTVAADLKTQPTASMPLSGIEGLTKDESCIIGHPRQHLVTIPAVGDNIPKFLLSTGSVTVENYTDSKSGKKGEFHHTFGFIIVEIQDDNIFYIRHVSANKNGSFYDLDYYVNDNKVSRVNSIPAMVLGDLHLGETCEYSLGETYRMLERFRPKNIFLHDIMNGSSISHHEKKDPFIALEREMDGSWDLEKEIKLSLDFLDTVIQYNPIIVKSNHDLFCDRFIIDSDWRKEKNKYAYLKYAKLKADLELPNGILPYNVQQKFGNRVKCLTEDDSYKVRGIEMAIHGHIGNAGIRGSATQFKRLNTKLITAHTHTPLKLDNLTTVGTLTKLRVGYNKGLSSWFNANALVHENGKSQLILIFKDKGWTTL